MITPVDGVDGKWFGRQRAVTWLTVLLPVLTWALFAGCVSRIPQHQFVVYDDPAGRYSILLPDTWEIDTTRADYDLFVATPSPSGLNGFDATVGITRGPLPCDRAMVDDPLSWYLDILYWREGAVELSRVETVVGGRRSLLVECVVPLPDERESMQLTLVTEAYGLIWQVTCSAHERARYLDLEATFGAILESLVIRGAWPGTGI